MKVKIVSELHVLLDDKQFLYYWKLFATLFAHDLAVLFNTVLIGRFYACFQRISRVLFNLSHSSTIFLQVDVFLFLMNDKFLI